MALFAGLMTQWLTDPDQAPDATEVVAGVRALATVTGLSGRDWRAGPGPAAPR